MWEFLQAYWSWIVFGLLFLWMMRMHSGGGACGMGHSHHGQDHYSGHQPTELTPQEPAATGGSDWAKDKDKTPAGSHSGGCH